MPSSEIEKLYQRWENAWFEKYRYRSNTNWMFNMLVEIMNSRRAQAIQLALSPIEEEGCTNLIKTFIGNEEKRTREIF